MEWLLLIIIAPYIYYIFRISKSLSRINRYESIESPSLFVSVIVACRDEGLKLPDLLRSLADQDYSPDLFEVIIVDDNSTDNTPALASACKKIRNLRLLKNMGSGKKAAIRTGVSEARGELVITTDADCFMGRGWIRIVASFYSEHKADLIICPVDLQGGKGFFQKFQELEFLSLQGITAGTAMEGNPVMCNGANLAFTRKVYLENSEKLHDNIASGDDIFLLHAVKRSERNKIMWLESAVATVGTKASLSYKAFIKQRTRWISKAGAYRDHYTISLGLATFAASLLQGLLLPAAVAFPDLLPVLATVILLKSIPDFLVLRNTSSRYGKKSLQGWFVPSLLVYPYYIIIVAFIQAGRSPEKR